MRILVSGATGFMGGTIARHLLEAGHDVRAMSRSTGNAMRSFAGHQPGRQALAEGRLTFIEADVTRPSTLNAAVENVEVVVQAVQFAGAPIEDPARNLTYAAVDRDGTRNLLAALVQVYGMPVAGGMPARFPNDAPRVVYMSGITASPDSPYSWDRAKWEAEEAVRASGLIWTIVRGCWAYGPQDVALNRIIHYSDWLPFVPIFGDGNETLTPLFVEDVGRFYALLLADLEKSRDTLLGLGGPDLVTLNEFLRLALDAMGRRRPILHIPKPLGKVQGALLQHFPGRPLSPAAVDFVSQGGVVSPAQRQLLEERFPEFQVTPARHALSSYLGT